MQKESGKSQKCFLCKFFLEPCWNDQKNERTKEEQRQHPGYGNDVERTKKDLVTCVYARSVDLLRKSLIRILILNFFNK